MCGIVGCAGTINKAAKDALAELLVIDSIRGAHSVGLAGVRVSDEVNVHKKAMLPHDYLQTKGYQDMMLPIQKILIGHNRWATKGLVNNTNAHPFEFDGVVGVHNGTIRKPYLLPDSG